VIRRARTQQLRAVADLSACRTQALGGHVEQCPACGAREYRYRSCGNRHCPKCQAGGRAAWLDREAGYLLPVEYHHLAAVTDEGVTFTYKDYRRQGRQRELTLTGAEFARRFLQHVLPRGFVRARHYGLLANRGREDKLCACRRLLLGEGVQRVAAAAVWPARPGEQPRRCAACGRGEMRVVEVLPRRGATEARAEDSS
jgi:hypothetical protein